MSQCILADVFKGTSISRALGIKLIPKQTDADDEISALRLALLQYPDLDFGQRKSPSSRKLLIRFRLVLDCNMTETDGYLV